MIWSIRKVLCCILFPSGLRQGFMKTCIWISVNLNSGYVLVVSTQEFTILLFGGQAFTRLVLKKEYFLFTKFGFDFLDV